MPLAVLAFSYGWYSPPYYKTIFEKVLMLIKIEKELLLRPDKILWVIPVDEKSIDYEEGWRSEIVFDTSQTLLSQYSFDELSNYLEEYRKLTDMTQWVAK